MVEGVINARRLKKQLEVLQSYRSLGLRTVLDAREFENERKRREHEIRLNKQQRGAAALASTSSSSDVTGIATGRRGARMASALAGTSATSTNTEHFRGELVTRRRNASQETRLPAAKAAKINNGHRVPSDATLAITYAAAVSSLTEGSPSPVPASYDVITDNSGHAIALDTSPERPVASTTGDDMDIEQQPSISTSSLPSISEEESSLCSQLGMSTNAYSALKARLVR